MMFGDIKKPSEISLQQKVLHELAKICWGKFVLREMISTEICIPESTRLLVNYRDKVLNRVPQTLNALPKSYSANLPKLFINEVSKAVIRLQQGYKEALLWEKKYQNVLPSTILNPITAGAYQAGNFIDPAGHFNDLAWAKCFANDGKKGVVNRFPMACFYGLEEMIINIWRIMETTNFSPYEICLQFMPFYANSYAILVGLWYYELRNNYDILIQNDNSYDVTFFHFRGLVQAFYQGHEYAARFFWSRLSDAKKTFFLSEFDIAVIAHAAENHYTGIVHFYYSILSQQRKYNVILRDFKNHESIGLIWSCLLDSPYYECVLDDALHFSIISTEIYEKVFTSLVLNIKESRIPIHAEIFKILWNNLQEESQKEILEMDLDLIGVLIEIKRIDLFEGIIQSLSCRLKQKILLYDWQSAGRSALNEFSKAGDYDAMLRYLLCFLIDRDSYTQRISLRIDPINFFHCYIKKMVTNWTKTRIPQLVIKEVNNIIDILDGTLNVISELLEKVEECKILECKCVGL